MPKMRGFGLLFATAIAGCAGGAVSEPRAASNATPARVVAVSMAADSSKVDKVGASDGALQPDGTPDLAVRVELEGPITALFLVGTDANGEPSGKFQADTLIGQEEMPKELSVAQTGKATAGLAVFEGERLLNKPDGSLPPLAGGPHTVTLYVNAASVTGDTGLRVYALGPDKRLTAGSVIRR